GFDGAKSNVQVSRSAREVAAGDRDRNTAAGRTSSDVQPGDGGRQVHDFEVRGVDRLQDIDVVVVPLRRRRAGRVHFAAVVGDDQTVIFHRLGDRLRLRRPGRRYDETCLQPEPLAHPRQVGAGFATGDVRGGENIIDQVRVAERIPDGHPDGVVNQALTALG